MISRKTFFFPLALGMVALLWIACAPPLPAAMTSDDYTLEADSLTFAGGGIESDDYSIVGVLTLAPVDSRSQRSQSYWVVPALAGVLQTDSPSNLWMFY